MRSFLYEAWRGAAAGIMIGSLTGLLAGLFLGAGFYLGLNLLALLGTLGAAVAVLAVIFRRGVQIAGFRRIAVHGLGGAVVGLVVGPTLYWWGWSGEFYACTIGSVVALALFAAINEALDALAEDRKAHTAN